jgi:hypothetical protein
MLVVQATRTASFDLDKVAEALSSAQPIQRLVFTRGLPELMRTYSADQMRSWILPKLVAVAVDEDVSVREALAQQLAPLMQHIVDSCPPYCPLRAAGPHAVGHRRQACR